MSTFLFTRPLDRLTGTMSVSTGTVDAEYPAINLINGFPDVPAKLTTTSGSWMLDAGAATRVDIVSVIHSNLAAGLDVKLQGHTADSWATPDVSQSFTIPARFADQFPVNVWLNLKALIPTDASRTKRYWRLLINAANTAPVNVGEWAMYTTRMDLGVRNIKWGSARHWDRPVVSHETDYRVRRTFDLGTTVRWLEVHMDPTDATLIEVERWWRGSKGTALPFLIVPHSNENDAWFVTFREPEQPYVRERRNYNLCTMAFQELSRGLYP